MDIIQKLTEKGLTVRLREPSQRYLICTADEPDTDFLFDYSEIYEENSLWAFTKWKYIPGPHYDDFWWQYETKEEAFQAAYDYYFGSPSVIDGWIIPLHTHPELNGEQVKTAITQAVTINPEHFPEIAKERRIRLGDEWMGWPQALKWHFLTCAHQSDSTITLCLRRDMQEAFIVREEG